MRKLSAINEDIFNGIQRRDSDRPLRKEDDLDGLSMEEMYEYIKSNYQKTRTDGTIEYRYDKLSNAFESIHIDIAGNKSYYAITYSHYNLDATFLPYKNKNLAPVQIEISPELLKKYGVNSFIEEYDVKARKDPRNDNKDIIGKIDNNLFVKILNYLIDTIPEKECYIKRK